MDKRLCSSLVLSLLFASHDESGTSVTFWLQRDSQFVSHSQILSTKVQKLQQGQQTGSSMVHKQDMHLMITDSSGLSAD